MKIQKVTIENFRSLKDVTIPMDGYTAFVGANGAGKSNILTALNVFFEGKLPNNAALAADDFYKGKTDNPFEVSVTLCDLSKEAENEFKHYYPHETLIFSVLATHENNNDITLTYRGKREGIRNFEKYFDATQGKSKIYSELREQYPALPEARNDDSREKALYNFEADNPHLCKEIDRNAKAYGATGIITKIEKYLKWIYVPAAKDIPSEQDETKNSYLEKLLALNLEQHSDFEKKIKNLNEKTKQDILTLADANMKLLDDISKRLTHRLRQWAHPHTELNLEWNTEAAFKDINSPRAKLQAGEAGHTGLLDNFGHGLQRSILLALLQVYSESQSDNQPTLILACEEPELYQHPPQARHISEVLQKLSNDGSQVLITTHSPYFVSGDRFESIRLTRKNDAGESEVKLVTAKELCKQLNTPVEIMNDQITALPSILKQYLSPTLSEMFFTPKLVLVEGPEDVAYLSTYFNLMQLWECYRSQGWHIVAVGGKTALPRAIALAQCLNIPTYVVFDADKSETAHKENEANSKHNKKLWELLGEEGAVSTELNITDKFTMWPNNIGETVRCEIKKLEKHETEAKK